MNDTLALVRHIGRWLPLAGLIGVLAGAASALFLALLEQATQIRLGHPWLVFLLPLGGLMVGWVYWRWGGLANGGTGHVIDQAHTLSTRVPARMTPLVLIGTVITHLFGGSAGREGTAVQMGASLADTLRRALRLTDPTERRWMLQAGISGGFSAVFGTPVAGVVFGMEVLNMGRVRYDALVPCLIAALVGDLSARVLGAHHAHYPQTPLTELDAALVLKVALAGVLFGLCAWLFISLTHAVKHAAAHWLRWPPLRPLVGGVAVIALAAMLQTDAYLGLSLPLIADSVNGAGVPPLAFLFKLVLTAVTLGTGFMGGEVTPLFVMGATLGFSLGGPLGVEPTLLASIGFVAVFAGASNTPLACALMGIELFGGGAALYLLMACALAYLFSGHRGIYMTQRLDTPKAPSDAPVGVPLKDL
jgi:H+/Cl- antiporter ClcA